jgi:hypothetical protein
MLNKSFNHSERLQDEQEARHDYKVIRCSRRAELAASISLSEATPPLDGIAPFQRHFRSGAEEAFRGRGFRAKNLQLLVTKFYRAISIGG